MNYAWHFSAKKLVTLSTMTATLRQSLLPLPLTGDITERCGGWSVPCGMSSRIEMKLF